MALAPNLVVAIIEAKQASVENKKNHQPYETNADIAGRVLANRKAESTVRRIWKEHKRSGNYRGIVVNNKGVQDKPKVLVFDLETSPIKAHVWGLWQQNVGLNMIDTEWFILSAAAKWLGDAPESIHYADMRGIVDTEDDSHILEMMWDLLDQSDIVITQNGIKFDSKKINARFILNGYQPPSPYKHIDTLRIAKANFAFTSNKLEFMTDKLCTTYKKMNHGKFAGFELWKQMMADNIEAWDECKEYNTYDVLSLEELYFKLAAWDKTHPNFNLYSDKEKHTCRCGSNNIVEHGFTYTGVSKFQRYKCQDCGTYTRGRENLFSKGKKKTLHMNVIN